MCIYICFFSCTGSVYRNSNSRYFYNGTIGISISISISIVRTYVRISISIFYYIYGYVVKKYKSNIISTNNK